MNFWDMILHKSYLLVVEAWDAFSSPGFSFQFLDEENSLPPYHITYTTVVHARLNLKPNQRINYWSAFHQNLIHNQTRNIIVNLGIIETMRWYLLVHSSLWYHITISWQVNLLLFYQSLDYDILVCYKYKTHDFVLHLIFQEYSQYQVRW